MKPERSCKVDYLLGYSDLLRMYIDDMLSIYDLSDHEMFRAIRDSQSIHRVAIETGMMRGTITLENIYDIDKAVFGGTMLRVRHRLKFMDSGGQIVMMNDAITRYRDHEFRELQMILDHLAFIRERSGLKIDIPPVRHHPRELFEVLNRVVYSMNDLHPYGFSMVYGRFIFEVDDYVSPH